MDEIRENPKLKDLAKAATEMTNLTNEEIFEYICPSPLHLNHRPPINVMMALKKYAESIEKSVDELDDIEKRQAIVNHILLLENIDG